MWTVHTINPFYIFTLGKHNKEKLKVCLPFEKKSSKNCKALLTSTSFNLLSTFCKRIIAPLAHKIISG